MPGPSPRRPDKAVIKASAAAVSRITSIAGAIIASYIDRSSPQDPRYWRGGAFIASDGPACWWCYDAAATTTGALGVLTHKVRLLRVAESTFNTAIQSKQLGDGQFRPDAVASGFFSVELGLSYLELRRDLSTHRAARWSRALARAARWLITSEQMTYYINGNVNLRQTEVMWLAWRATGDPKFHTWYEREAQFALAPAAARWSRFGLRLTKPLSGRYDDDGAGYLVESDGDNSYGYDPNYTAAQLDTATQLYVLTRQVRWLRLINILFNQERPRINSAFTLNATHGSRKNCLTPFLSAGPAVLVMSGARPSLLGFWQGQVTRIVNKYTNAMNYTEPPLYQGMSASLAMPLLTEQWLASGRR